MQIPVIPRTIEGAEGRLLTCDIGNNWEAEGSSLSGAGLGASHQVSALQADRDGVPLDGRGLGVLASLHVC